MASPRRPELRDRLTAPNNGFSSLGFVGSYAGPSETDVTVSADVTAFIDHDVAFHIGIARASKNSLLYGLYQSFETSLRDSVRRTNCMEVADDPHGEFHDELFGAIERGDHFAATSAALTVLDDHARQAPGAV